jgi:hypothetical protein
MSTYKFTMLITVVTEADSLTEARARVRANEFEIDPTVKQELTLKEAM